VDFISGCAMLMSRIALEKIGLLDSSLFAYHEDVDWCYRGSCLASIKSQLSVNDELIIIHEGISAAKSRNKGARQAKNQLIVFIDGDMILAPNFFTLLRENYLKYKFKFAGFNTISLEENWIQKCHALDRNYWRAISEQKKGFINWAKHLPSFAFIFEKELFQKLGGYDESIYYFEDADITRRAYQYDKMFYDPELKVWHIELSNLKEVYKAGANKSKGAKGWRPFLESFFHPFNISLILPYFVVGLMRSLRERKYYNFYIAF
jgi:GT2 family glycosyltransferase